MTLDKIRAVQTFVQKAKAEGVYTHMIPKNAMVTSVAFPLAFAATGALLLTKGVYHMTTGTGKLD